ARAAQRWRALIGYASQDASSPYPPFAQMLERYAELADEAAVRSDLELAGAAASGISPRLAAIGVQDDRPPLLASDERYRFFDSVTQFLLAASRRRPLLLVLEDLHCADADTLDLLAHLSRFIEHQRMVIAVSYPEAECGERAVACLNALQRLQNALRIELEGLRETELRRILEDIDERPSAELMVRVARETDGNPLFAREVLQSLVDKGRFELEAPGNEPLAIPASAAAAVRQRFERLSENARALLTTASASADAFTLEVASVAAGIAEEAALDALDEALAAQLIRVRGGATYEFHHALFAQAVYALLNPPRQERLHRRIAEAIVQIRGRRADEDAGAVAEQYARSRTVPGAEAGISYALAAASHAERAAAFEARARLLQIALDLTPRDDPSYPRTLGLLAAA